MSKRLPRLEVAPVGFHDGYPDPSEGYYVLLRGGNGQPVMSSEVYGDGGDGEIDPGRSRTVAIAAARRQQAFMVPGVRVFVWSKQTGELELDVPKKRS